MKKTETNFTTVHTQVTHTKWTLSRCS